MATVNLVIDIGSSLTTIYKEGEGIVLHEPSVVIITGDEKSYKMTDFGLDAYNQIAVLQPGHKVLYPIQEGAITYKKATLKMMEYFLGKIIVRSDYFFKPKVRAFLNVPCGSGVEERKLFEEVLYAAGVDETFMLDAPIFAAYGAGIPITKRPELVVDIGGGIVDIALINNGGIIKGCSYGLGGIAVDNGIIEGLENSLALQVGLITSESLKKEIGSLYENENASVSVFGKNTVSGNPKSSLVTTKHVRTMIEYYYGKIADLIKAFMKDLPNDVFSQLAENGIIITGGGACMRGIETFMQNKLKTNVIVPTSCEYSSVLGGARLLANPKKLNELLGLM
ncbi:MAG: rod shape-determining protein [Clostridia bacterium]|nr:rod shape-determining protein [Clostridia bacterium]MBR2875179.1 rod shape-determining protein [Clostridia bacterium]